MKPARYWRKIYKDSKVLEGMCACHIRDIKLGDSFCFTDFDPGNPDSMNQWHYGVATKDAYKREDGVWVVESEEVRPPVLEIS